MTTREILVLAAAVNGVLIVALAIGTALIKQWRRRRERHRLHELTRLRPVLLRYLAIWEDDDASDLAEILIAHRSSSATFEELVSGLLPKLRGADRSVLVDILRRRGTIQQACQDTRFRTSLRRALSAELLGSAGAVEGIPFVARLLDDRNPQVRLAAVRALGRIGTAEAATALLAHLEQIRPGIPPQPVTMSLLRIGVAAAGPLREALDAKNPRVRRMACEVLGVLGVIPAAGTIERVLHDDPDLGARIGAAQALGRLGLPGSVAELIRTLKIEHEAAVLAAACTALGQIGDPNSGAALNWAIGHANPTVRVAAGNALGLLGEPGLELLRGVAAVPGAGEAGHSGGDAAREVLARQVIASIKAMADLAPVQLEFRFN